MEFKKLKYCGQHVTTGTVSGVPTTTPTNEGSEHLVFDANGKIIEYYVWTKDSTGTSKWVGGAYKQTDPLDVNNTAINYVPNATGNVNNRNSVVTDPAGDKWIIDANGDATKVTTTFTDVKYSKLLFVDPVNGNNTTGTGSDNNMFQTITKALTVANGSGYRIVLAAGTYTENPTISLPNIDIVTVAGSDRGNTFINGTVTFTHTSSSSGIQGIAMTNLVHSGAGALYVTDCQVNTLLNKTSTGYIEITDTQLQGTSTSTLSDGTGLIKDSLIANMTISGALSGYTLKSNIIDATGSVTYTGGAFYNLQDNSGNIITTAGTNMETGLIAQGLSSALAKQYVTDFSNKLAMINPDTNNANVNLVSWNTTSKRLEITSLKVAGSILAANVCVNNVVNIPNGNPLDIKTVGTGGDFADLATALASASVVTGTNLKVLNDLTITSTVNVNKAVVIDFNSKVISSSTSLPVNMFNVTDGATLKNGTFSHLKTTNTSVETIVSINSPSAPVYIYNNIFNIQEFAISTRGQFYIGKNTFNYVGASLTNSHRFIILYGNAVESRIYENKFNCSLKQGTTRYSNFILATSTTGTAYSGKLFINNNTQLSGDLRQFFMHEAGVPTGMELYVANNTFNDFNGGIGIFGVDVYNGYSKIGIYSNTQGGDAVGSYKGVFYVDGTGAINENVVLEYADNIQATTALRVDYLSYAVDASTEIAIKNTITFVNKKTKVTIEQADTNLGLIVQQLKSRKTFINGVTGSGTETDPYLVPANAVWRTGTNTPTATGNTTTSLGVTSLPTFYENTTTGVRYYVDSSGVSRVIESSNSVLFGSSAPTSTTAQEGDEFFVTSDGTSSGTITAQYIFDATSSTWVLRPTPVSKLTTTSLAPKTGTGTSYVNPTLTSDTTLVDEIQLSDGSYIRTGKVTWTGHGLPIHTYFYASSVAPYYTSTIPTTGYVQQLFFTQDENTIDVSIQQGENTSVSGGSLQFAKTVYFNATNPTSATIFDIANPPVTNDNTLKADSSNIYIGTDGATWTYNSTTSTYNTYVYPTTVPHGVFAYQQTGQSIPSAVVQSLLNLNTVSNTVGSAWNAATGEFTVQRAGWYSVGLKVFFQAGNWTNGNQTQAIITKNGSYVSSNYEFAPVNITGWYMNSNETNERIYLNVGDKVRGQVYQNSGTAKLINGGIYSTFSIVEIK